MAPVAAVLWECRAVSRIQHRLVFIFDEREFAFKKVDEFILMAVLMPLARPLAWRERHEVDAERGESTSVPQPLAGSTSACFVELIGVAGADANRYGLPKADLGGDSLVADSGRLTQADAAYARLGGGRASLRC